MNNSFDFAFVGMSHLGLNYLAATSEKGFKTIGIDNNRNTIKRLKNFDTNYVEPNLRKTLKKNKKRIYFSANFSDLQNSKIIFISQDVKTDSKGKSNIKNIYNLVKQTIKFLSKKSVLVILSQIPPGFTRKINFDHSRLYYQVETLILGNSLKRALKPERIIIGCKNKKTTISNLFYNYLKKFNCPIFKMKYESAELTKISINLFLASSVTTANILSRACEKISADWYEILPAIKLDKRIGKYAYLKPGLGISGGNVERDIYAIRSILKNDPESRSVPEVFQRNSEFMKSWVFRILKKEKILKKRKLNIGILGLAYKENTNSTKNSPSLYLINKLSNNYVRIYDPKVKLENKNKNCFQVKKIENLINNSDILIFLTPWREFKKVNKILKSNKKRKKILIDPYRIIDYKIIQNTNYKYFTIGK